MIRRDELESMVSIVEQTMKPKNENTPFRIFSATRMPHPRFTDLVTRLQEQQLIEIKSNQRPTGSRNKFFATEKGKAFVTLYHQVKTMAGFIETPEQKPSSDF